MLAGSLQDREAQRVAHPDQRDQHSDPEQHRGDEQHDVEDPLVRGPLRQPTGDRRARNVGNESLDGSITAIADGSGPVLAHTRPAVLPARSARGRRS